MFAVATGYTVGGLAVFLKCRTSNFGPAFEFVLDIVDVRGFNCQLNSDVVEALRRE